MPATLIVEVSAEDHDRVAKRIEMLEGVDSVGEVEEGQHEYKGWADLHVRCGCGTSRFDVEELLRGVSGVEVRVVK